MQRNRKTNHGGKRTPGPGKRIGRPPIAGAPLRRRPIGMTEGQWAWLERSAALAGISVDGFLRAKIEELMNER